MSATSEDNSRDRVTWEDVVAFDEAIKKKGGRFSEEDLIKMFELNDKLDKSTLPEGVKFPLGYQGDEKEQK